MNVVETIKIISCRKRTVRPHFVPPKAVDGKYFMIHDSSRYFLSPINNFHVLSVLGEIAKRGSSRKRR